MSDKMDLDNVIGEYGFDDESAPIVGGKVESYKATEKRIDRIAIFLFRKNPKASDNAPIKDRYLLDSPPVFRTAPTHYKEGSKLGYVVCTKGECCKQLGSAKSRTATVILKYQTDEKGNLIASGSPDKWIRMMPWSFGDAKRQDLLAKNTQFPLNAHDLLVKCKEATYQNLEFTSCREAIWRKPQIAEYLPTLLAQMEAMRPQVDQLIGNVRTDAEILEKLGLDVGTSDFSAPGDFSDVLKLED